MGAGLHLVPLNIQAGAGGSSIVAQYRFDNSIVEADPGNGDFRMDNATPALVTELFISSTTDNNNDLDNILGFVSAGDQIYIQQDDDATRFILLTVTANVDNGGWYSIAGTIPASGVLFGNNAKCTILFLFGGTGPGDHGALTGLADDDHLNYFFALGRAGGQSMIGGTLPADGITIQANVPNTGAGRIFMNTPIEFGPYSTSTALYGFNYDPPENFTAAFVGGGLNFSGTIDFSDSTFIYESFRGAPQINSGVAPGFAAFTVLQALPLLNAGSVATHVPLAATIINAGPTQQNTFSGTRTSGGATGISFSPQVKATLSGAVMNVTQMNGLILRPTYSTVAGSSVSFGTIRGLLAQNPVAGLFQPGAGTESMTAYYGVDVQAITFGGNVAKAAIRSNIAAASNARFLSNIGTAASDFGAGTIHFNDSIAAHFGNTVATPDAGIYFDGADLVLDTQISGANASKTVVLHGIRVEADVFPVSDFVRRTASTNLLNSSWRLSGVTSGDMADGFGTALFWSIEDDAAVRQNIAFFSAERAGADNSGLYRLRVYTAGVANEIYQASADGFTHTATNLGFYGTAPIAKQLAVPVTAAGVHAALVALGLIT